MSDFINVLIDMLPLHSALQDKSNELRKVLDYTLGEYMDNLADIGDMLFLDSATGGWLDAHGRDYGVSRRLDETDEDYRERIIFEKLEYLTAHNLQEIYGLPLFAYVSSFDATDNDLTSDNPYIADSYMSIADNDLQNTLNKKFILDGGITWL